MNLNNKVKHPAGRICLDAVTYLFGSLLYAIAIIVFTAPNDIAPGGFVGISTIVNHVFPNIEIGTFTLLMNIPLLLISWWKLGRQFTIRTAIVSAGSSALMDLLETFDLIPRFVGQDTGERILAAVFGGILMGVGIGLLFARGATTGGSEVIARLIERKLPHMPIGRLLLVVDIAIVCASMLVFGEVQTGMCAIITIYVSTRLIDMIMYGGDSGRMLLIMTDKEQEIADAIMKDIHRGVTMLNATGAYTGNPRRVLMCAMRPSEVYQLRRVVRAIDPHAFTIVVATEQTLGEGFIVENE